MMIKIKKEKKSRFSNFGKVSLFLLFYGLCLLLAILSLLMKIIVPHIEVEKNAVEIDSIYTTKYDEITDTIEIEITPSSTQNACAVVNAEINQDELSFVEMEDNHCYYKGKSRAFYVYFKNESGIISDSLYIDNYVKAFSLKENYYLATTSSIDVSNAFLTFGNPSISYEFDGDSVILENDQLVAREKGTTNISVFVNEKLLKELQITVTDTIVAMPKEFDTKKPYLPCKAYTEEEAILLDQILASRIAEAGYGTRAGVVAAARFLTLEFPYKISYFYENGRVHESGANYVDGEGRYYKLGLYLSESKYGNLLASIAGPAMWGCKLTNYEDAPEWGFIRYAKVPNGLDCSGFVSWVLLNGGFDVGDIGAGESAYPHQLTDTGKYTPLTNHLIQSGQIRVGDLLNFSGHIAVIIGIDADHYYVAESLNTYKGVVMKKYNKNTVNRLFTHVVLMDAYYKEDGNIIDMWY